MPLFIAAENCLQPAAAAAEEVTSRLTPRILRLDGKGMWTGNGYPHGLGGIFSCNMDVHIRSM